MLPNEMYNTFNVLYNNITSNQAPGLNEYEVSIILTKAQYQLLQEWVNRRTDISNGGFDRSAKRQVDFSSLIITDEISPATAGQISSLTKIDPRSTVYITTAKWDIFSVLNEKIRWSGTGRDIFELSVIPLANDTYDDLMKVPYKFPPKDCAWRLMNSSASTSGDTYFIEILAPNIDPTAVYIRRYVRKPAPIILVNLPTGVTIEGINVQTPCELPEEAQQEIIERAVTLAKIAWQGGTSTLVSAANAGKRD